MTSASKKPKPERTHAMDVERLDAACTEMLDAVIELVSATVPNDSQYRKVSAKVSKYRDYQRQLGEEWNDDGTRKPAIVRVKQPRPKKHFKRYREGDLTFAVEMDKLAALRVDAFASVVQFAVAGRGLPNRQIGTQINSMFYALQRYLSRLHLVNSQWTTEGVWTGPKRKAKKCSTNTI